MAVGPRAGNCVFTVHQYPAGEITASIRRRQSVGWDRLAAELGSYGRHIRLLPSRHAIDERGEMRTRGVFVRKASTSSRVTKDVVSNWSSPRRRSVTARSAFFQAAADGNTVCVTLQRDQGHIGTGVGQ
jgi:hypothetical protein